MTGLLVLDASPWHSSAANPHVLTGISPVRDSMYLLFSGSAEYHVAAGFVSGLDSSWMYVDGPVQGGGAVAIMDVYAGYARERIGFTTGLSVPLVGANFTDICIVRINRQHARIVGTSPWQSSSGTLTLPSITAPENCLAIAAVFPRGAQTLQPPNGWRTVNNPNSAVFQRTVAKGEAITATWTGLVNNAVGDIILVAP